MASKILLVVFVLAFITVSLAASLQHEENEELTLEDFREYFAPVEKRGAKMGCK